MDFGETDDGDEYGDGDGGGDGDDDDGNDDHDGVRLSKCVSTAAELCRTKSRHSANRYASNVFPKMMMMTMMVMIMTMMMVIKSSG